MKKWLIGIVILVLLAGAGYVTFGRGLMNAAATLPAAAPVVLAVSDDDPVVADAKVVPVESAELNWTTSGSVAEILVKEGDIVAKDAPLARLDSHELQLQVEKANVMLGQAKADYAKLKAGATPEHIADAQAQLDRARAQLRETNGSVSEQDIAAAQAQLAEMRAHLAQLQAGPLSPDVQIARATLDKAITNLQAQRDSLSAAKTNAQLAVEQAANTLRDRQAEYSRIHWDNVQLRTGHNGLFQAQVDQEEAATRAVGSAEQTLAQAQIAYEQARHAESTGIQAAEAQVRDAQAALDKLFVGADADQIAQAKAQIAQAQAKLVSLQGEQRAGSIEMAAASVASAEANLARLNAPPREVDLASEQMQIESAAVALKQAELTLDQATLKAPMAGVVAEVNLKVGEVPSNDQAAFVLANLTHWQIETSDLTELNVVRIRESNPVTITFDALPGLELPGNVARIKAVGKNQQGDIVYTVVVTPMQWDERLRWNMTAAVAIKTSR